jgi:hypothetical protein
MPRPDLVLLGLWIIGWASAVRMIRFADETINEGVRVWPTLSYLPLKIPKAEIL